MTIHIVHDINANYYALKNIEGKPEHPLSEFVKQLTHDEFRELWWLEKNGIEIQIDIDRLKESLVEVRATLERKKQSEGHHLS